MPWKLIYTDGKINYVVNDSIFNPDTSIDVTSTGQYTIISSVDKYGCLANILGSAEVIFNPIPNPLIYPHDTTIYIGDVVTLNTGGYPYVEWYLSGDTIPISISQ